MRQDEKIYRTLAVDRIEAGRTLGGVSAKTIDRLISSGKLRAKKIGRRVVIQTSELQRYLEAQ